MVKNDDAAFILIGNVAQAIDNIACITFHEVYIHASKACSEGINGNENRTILPNVIFKLLHVTKAPVFPEFNGARLKIGILITNHVKLLAGINKRLITLNDKALALHAPSIAP